MNEGKSQIILSSDHEYNTLADEWRWCPVGASQVGPGFGFRGSTLQNTIHYKAPCKTHFNTHFKTQCKAHFKTDCKVQGNTLQSTLQINGKSNNKEHTAKHTARQCDANTLESSLQNNVKYYDIKNYGRHHKTGLKNRTECNAHCNNQTKMKSTFIVFRLSFTLVVR